jgi:hypothetical protein
VCLPILSVSFPVVLEEEHSPGRSPFLLLFLSNLYLIGGYMRQFSERKKIRAEEARATSNLFIAKNYT